MTLSFKPVSVAIGDLVIHPANVRARSPETYAPEDIADLKASIAVLGLLQPLLVQEIDGVFGVLAGGRRHAALRALVADKSAKGFTARTKVECRLVPVDCDLTTAVSLAENITQAPMSAIDEFEAFARMMEVDGQTPESIAATFGTTVAAVKGRLRYGLIHPDIRAAVRAKAITLDVMKAFADHPSQEVQKAVFEALTKEGNSLQGIVKSGHGCIVVPGTPWLQKFFLIICEQSVAWRARWKYELHNCGKPHLAVRSSCFTGRRQCRSPAMRRAFE